MHLYKQFRGVKLKRQEIYIYADAMRKFKTLSDESSVTLQVFSLQVFNLYDMKHN